MTTIPTRDDYLDFAEWLKNPHEYESLRRQIDLLPPTYEQWQQHTPYAYETILKPGLNVSYKRGLNWGVIGAILFYAAFWALLIWGIWRMLW